MYANSEDFQVLAITTMVSSFAAEWNDRNMKLHHEWKAIPSRPLSVRSEQSNGKARGQLLKSKRNISERAAGGEGQDGIFLGEGHTVKVQPVLPRNRLKEACEVISHGMLSPYRAGIAAQLKMSLICFL